MTQVITRKQFLRGDIRNHRASIRPPWALTENEFIDKCTQCGECIEFCQENILKKDKNGFPEVNFSKGECTLCHDCVDHCEVEALSQDLDKLPWTLKANITEQCLVYQGVHCMVCREQCEPEAIKFTHKAGFPPIPHLNQSLCNGCGACFRPCPGQAIKLSYQYNQNDQRENDLNKENAS